VTDVTRLLLVSIAAAGLASRLPAQSQPPAAAPVACCQRVEVIANRSSGFESVPEYLSVWIEPDSRHWAFQREFVSAAREAFGEWSDAGVPVIFDFTSDSTRAMIRVFWRNRFSDRTTGRSTWWTADGLLKRVDVEVALAAHPGVDTPIVRAVVMHEIGHLLGFSHVNESDSIMSYYISRPALSSRDIARMRTRFALKSGQP
jgi:hypothetical protein